MVWTNQTKNTAAWSAGARSDITIAVGQIIGLPFGLTYPSAASNQVYAAQTKNTATYTNQVKN